jgi:Cytidylate kinase
MGQAHDCPVDRIRDAIAAWRGRPLVVAIDGRSGAGKSTLARQVLAVVDAALVECDLFYRDMPDDQRAALTPEEGVVNYFDWERLRDQALVPLRRWQAARFRPFDWRRAAGLASPVMVLPRPVVIVEGCTRHGRSWTAWWTWGCWSRPTRASGASGWAGESMTWLGGRPAGKPPRRSTSRASGRRARLTCACAGARRDQPDAPRSS